MKVVNGAYRGLRALLESIDIDNYCATVKIDQVSQRNLSLLSLFILC